MMGAASALAGGTREMQQQLTGQAYLERYGHAWDDPSLARDYVERSDRDSDSRAEGFKVMMALLPFSREQSFKALDIGTGQGFVASHVLVVVPKAITTGLDVAGSIIDIASERRPESGDRCSVV